MSLECYLCSVEVGLSDSLRFIKFDHTTLVFHDRCRDEIQEVIEERREEFKKANETANQSQ